MKLRIKIAGVMLPFLVIAVGLISGNAQYASKPSSGVPRGEIIKNLALLWTYPPLYDSSFADLDGDGIEEFIGAPDCYGLSLAAYDINQNMIWSHELFADGHMPYYVIADLDGDGKKEIVGKGKDEEYSVYYPERNLNAGKRDYTIFVMDCRGSNLIERRFDSELYPAFHPVLVDDLNHDGRKEIVCVKETWHMSKENYVSYLYILDDELTIVGNATIPKPYQDAQFSVCTKDISADDNKEVICSFKYGDMVHAFGYSSKGLVSISLSEADKARLAEDMKETTFPPDQPREVSLDVSMGSEKYLLKSTSVIVEDNKIPQREFVVCHYTCGFEIYNSSGKLRATYTSAQIYTACPRIVVTDLDGDMNDEIIWEDYKEHSADEIYGFKVFALK